MPTRLTLRTELLGMRDEDLAAREKLRQAGEMAAGNYHPEMEAVHKKNASRMAAILKEFGWPTWTLVGVDGEEAAWVVVLHSIGERGFSASRCACWSGLWMLARLRDGKWPAWPTGSRHWKDGRSGTVHIATGMTPVITPCTNWNIRIASMSCDTRSG